MKILVIPDLHWLDTWKKLIEENTFDKVVFLWDYVDSFDIPDEKIFSNLLDIINYKKDNMDSVELLLWNHDIQYIWEWNNCSWRRESMAASLNVLFNDNIELFNVVYEEWGYIFSHAWITNTRLSYISKIMKKYWIEWYSWLNLLLKTSNIDSLFMCWHERGWLDFVSWPLWADKEDTTKYWLLEWVIQVVWHTKVRRKTVLPHIIYCDVLSGWIDNRPIILET